MNLGHALLVLRSAIQRHCAECLGYYPDDVEGCCGINCPLYPFRLGADPTEEHLNQYAGSLTSWCYVMRKRSVGKDSMPKAI